MSMFDRRQLFSDAFSVWLPPFIYFLFILFANDIDAKRQCHFFSCVLWWSQGEKLIWPSQSASKRKEKKQNNTEWANFKCPYAIIVAAHIASTNNNNSNNNHIHISTDGQRWRTSCFEKCRHRFPYKNASTFLHRCCDNETMAKQKRWTIL